MSYNNLIIQSNAELLDAIVNQMVAEGWPIIAQGDGDNTGSASASASDLARWVILQGPDGVPFTLWDSVNDGTNTSNNEANIRGFIYNEYDPAVPVFDQFVNNPRAGDFNSADVGSPTGRNNFPGGGGADAPTQLWLFTTQHYCHAVWQTLPGHYHHFHFGQIEKGFDFFGGLYIGGTHVPASQSTDTDSTAHTRPFDQARSASSLIRCYFYHGDFDGEVRRTCRTANSTSFDTHRPLFNLTTNSRLYDFIPPPHHGRAVLIPMRVMVTAHATDRGFVQGHVRDTRVTSIQNLNPSEIITFEQDSWQVFPFSRKAPEGVENASLNQAQAYKIIQ